MDFQGKKGSSELAYQLFYRGLSPIPISRNGHAAAIGGGWGQFKRHSIALSQLEQFIERYWDIEDPYYIGVVTDGRLVIEWPEIEKLMDAATKRLAGFLLAQDDIALEFLRQYNEKLEQTQHTQKGQEP